VSVIVEDAVAKKLEWVPGRIKYVKSRYNQVVSFTVCVIFECGAHRVTYKPGHSLRMCLRGVVNRLVYSNNIH
jgi:hypothetical protein